MNKNTFKVIVACIFFSLLLYPYREARCQGWSDFRIRSLPDSSFALVEFDKYGNKVRHFAYRDVNGRIDIDQLIYCLGTFGDETWVKPENKEAARKHLEDHYHRLRTKLLKEEIEQPVDINTASLKDLVRLTNIGPVTAVRICRHRETRGLFQAVDDIKKVEGIGPAIFAGIKHYIIVR